MLAVLDNTVLSNFATVERPDLVRLALGEAVLSPEQVMREQFEGARRGRVPACDWSWLPVARLERREVAVYEQLLVHLSAGEAACLAIASIRNGRVFTDDRDARELGAQLRIPISGTLGLLVSLVDQEHLALRVADEYLARMLAAGYRSPVYSLTELM